MAGPGKPLQQNTLVQNCSSAQAEGLRKKRGGKTASKKQVSSRVVRKAVSTSVWTELMRTRLEKEGPGALLAYIQAESECRIHIDREEVQVQIHGTKEAVAKSIKLLDALKGDAVTIFCMWTLRSFQKPLWNAFLWSVMLW
jgi:hypothetical protein